MFQTNFLHADQCSHFSICILEKELPVFCLFSFKVCSTRSVILHLVNWSLSTWHNVSTPNVVKCVLFKRLISFCNSRISSLITVERTQCLTNYQLIRDSFICRLIIESKGHLVISRCIKKEEEKSWPSRRQGRKTSLSTAPAICRTWSSNSPAALQR